MQLTLMSYNIKTGLWSDGGLEAIARIVEEVGPDIVALQEVDRHMARSGNVDQASWLGARLGYHAIYGPAMAGEDLGNVGGEYGIALLSRVPIREQALRLLYRPDHPSGRPVSYAEQRIVLGCAVDMGGVLVDVFCTHFGLTPEQRLIQARETAELCAGWHPGRPLVLMGDFNALPGDPVIAVLRETLVDLFDRAGVTGDSRLTFPSGPLGSRTPDGWAGGIDYIFVSSHFDDPRVEVIREAVPASDHAPVVARVELRAG